MPTLRVIILWHQHQPFYKDLVTGEYRLPWVRMHALKDYYGMVKLLDEFPKVHLNFNLVPSLIRQVEDYAAGTAKDPFLEVAAKPARDLTPEERRFALQYLFQANPVRLIGRHPRYHELWERYRSHGDSADRAERYFTVQDFTDLQVLSQLAWFDEFFLEEEDLAELARKERNYTEADQAFVIRREREIVSCVLPAHAEAAKRGGIELSTSPFYHPILPLLCDTDQGAVSTPGLQLPQNRLRRPEDAREQLVRGLEIHERVFGVRPKGVWPSEGSVSEEALAIAHSLGVTWMATDEGVLGRSIGFDFARDGSGRLFAAGAERLYNIYRYENSDAHMHMVFRDHALSDLIGFVYSGMKPAEAASHLINTIRQAAEPVLAQGRDAVVPIILDGENAWEFFEKSGREFLRRFYDALQTTPGIEATTMSEAIQRHNHFVQLGGLTPGSWINANFNVWIGAPEDNKSWDYLHAARAFYDRAAPGATEAQRKLAFEELLIAEGSDWNWWYGPEHHSANDRDFDELYRKHLSNAYQALGGIPPDYLAQPIIGGEVRPDFVPQTGYIYPRIDGSLQRYFEWIGAAMYTSDRRSGSMHGRQFILEAVYAGINEEFVCGRLDFIDSVGENPFSLVVNVESRLPGSAEPKCSFRIDVDIQNKLIHSWSVARHDTGEVIASSTATSEGSVLFALKRVFEFRVPLAWLDVNPQASGQAPQVRVRFSLWQDRLPVDTLPLEGWVELLVVSEEELQVLAIS